MALTLRIEENPDAAAALEKVKELFGETSATKAIYAALEYAAERDRHINNNVDKDMEIGKLEQTVKSMQRVIVNFSKSIEDLQKIRLQN